MVTKPCFTNFTVGKAKIPYNLREFMILNKFSHISLSGALKSFSLQLLALSLFSCSKTANSNGNKAYIAVTHVAYGLGPINIALDKDSLLPAPLSFGNTSGSPGNPYDTAVSRISDMELVQGSQILMQGNSAFQQGSYYSIFVFDSLHLDSISLGMLILQNNPPSGSDTSCTFRFLNFSPGSKIGIMLIYVHDTTFVTINDSVIHIAVRDTVVVGPSSFVANNPSPAAYPFSNSARSNAHTGTNQVIAYVDSVRPRSDSSNWRRLGTLLFESPKSYNLYLQNYFFPGPQQDTLQILSIPVN
jgi:hypothetical protein